MIDPSKYAVLDCETNDLIGDVLHLIGVYLPDVDHFVEVTHYDDLVLAIGERRVIMHNAAFDMKIIKKHFGYVPHNFREDIHDTMLMSYVLDPGREGHSLSYWGTQLGHEKMEHTDFTEYSSEMVDYCRNDCVLTWKLFHHLWSELLEDPIVKDLYIRWELPYLQVIMMMEERGVQVDIESWKEVVAALQADVDELVAQMRELVPKAPGKVVRTKNPRKDLGDNIGQFFFVTQDEDMLYVSQKWEEFNPRSGKQIAWALKELYDWEPDQISDKTGDATTSKEVLNELDYPLAELLVKFSEVNKLLTTYGDTLLEKVREGRLHTSYNPCVTLTGRLSSSNPNLQNIPKRGEKGSMIRNFFVASPGYKLVVIDFDSFQMRIFAWYMAMYLTNYDDRAADMARMFCAKPYDADPHGFTANLIFGEGYTKQQRLIAKTFNFATLFGAGFERLCKSLKGSTIEEIYEARIRYMERFPFVQHLKEIIWHGARELGGRVYSSFGRMGYYPDITSPDPKLSGRAKRQVFNFLIQATEADIMKIYQLQVLHYIKKYDLDVYQILQVHDEIVYEVREDLVEYFVHVLHTIVDYNVWLPGIPIVGTAKVKHSWGEN